VAIVAIAFFSLGIKSQQRAGMLASVSSSAMTQQALSGASARFMGGIFRAYTVAVREVRHGWPPLGGSYHSQAALLVVPRALWPDKPHVASEQLYYLLGVTEEDYGTAFAINLYGCLFDFGLLGCLIGAAVVGVLLRPAIEQFWDGFAGRRAGATLAVLATMCKARRCRSRRRYPGGIVSAIGLTGAFVLVQVCNQSFMPCSWLRVQPRRQTGGCHPDASGANGGSLPVMASDIHEFTEARHATSPRIGAPTSGRRARGSTPTSKPAETKDQRVRRVGDRRRPHTGHSRPRVPHRRGHGRLGDAFSAKVHRIGHGGTGRQRASTEHPE
jgi:hypothetical protein